MGLLFCFLGDNVLTLERVILRCAHADIEPSSLCGERLFLTEPARA